MRNDGTRHRIVHEIVHQINAVTHPLIRDATGELAIESKFKIHTGIEGTLRLVHEPFGPVCILFPNLRYFLAPAPSGTVIVPHNFDLAYVSKRATLHRVACRFRMGLASMLRSHLYDDLALQNGFACGFDFG